MTYNLYHAKERPPRVFPSNAEELEEELERELSDEELYDADHGEPWCPEPPAFEDFTFMQAKEKALSDLRIVRDKMDRVITRLTNEVLGNE